MFFRRRRDAGDDWLRPKMALFGLGAALALLGIGLESDWLIWAAMLALGAGLILRLLPGSQEPR